MLGLIKTAIICVTIVACLWIFMNGSSGKRERGKIPRKNRKGSDPLRF